MNKIFKLGYMPTRRSFFSKEDALKYKKIIFEEISQLIPKNVEIVGLEWLNDEGLLYDDKDAVKVASFFIGQEVDALFAPHCNFGTENAVAQVAKKIQKPLLIWGPRDEAPLQSGKRLRDSQCGLFATSKVLQRYNVPFTYIVTSQVTDSVFRRGFINFIKAANVVKFTKNTRIGQVASRPQSFYSIIVNENELLEKFGIEIIPITLGSVVRQVNQALSQDNVEIDEIVSTIKGVVNFTKVSDESTRKIAALKYVMSNIIKEYDLQAVAFQCWDELQFQLGICSCFVHALITDEGTPFACESDIHGAISSLMLQAASMFSEPTFFSDLTIRHPENGNAELLWHCGAFPPSLSINKENSVIGDHFVLPSHAPGTCNWQLKKGNITVIRFDGINGEYSLFCGEGKAIDGPYTLGTYVYLEVNDWPMWEEKIIYGPYIHHTSCIYGNFSSVLYEATRYLDGIKFDPAEPTLEQIQKGLRSN
ncbi:MAG TPA: L-fucose/L-arabinose isomerase family protein [Prolixibacteraceae bacterium]|nr:L-fucose/L-arabinose isomerase family protein [Prolixibacteraceae bacterium]